MQEQTIFFDRPDSRDEELFQEAETLTEEQELTIFFENSDKDNEREEVGAFGQETCTPSEVPNILSCNGK